MKVLNVVSSIALTQYSNVMYQEKKQSNVKLINIWLIQSQSKVLYALTSDQTGKRYIYSCTVIRKFSNPMG